MTFTTKFEAGCTVVTLDRPPVNAVDPAVVAALGDWADAYTDQAPVILTGAGASFCAGVDVKAFLALDPAGREAFFAGITRMVRALVRLRVPLVAALNGHGLGGGFVLALCADWRVVSDGDHRFGLTEAKAGVPFPVGPLEVIRAELPPHLLRRLTLSSEIVGAGELVAGGVFDEMAAPEALRAKALAAAQRLAAQPAFTAVKRQIRGPLQDRLAELG